MDKRAVIGGAIIVAVLLGLVLIAIIPGNGAGHAGGGAAPLPPAEVRAYQGKDLSSISDFHENSIKGPQQVDTAGYRLNVTGLVNRSRSYTYDEVLAKFPHYSKVVSLHCVEGWSVTILWEGVLVRDIIADAGADPRANTVVLTARDGYTTSFPLAYFTGKDILMAYRMNNITIPAERGYPFQLVAEDKWGYKWIKWIEKIELTGDPAYRGYWEQRGYSDAGDLDRPFFG